MTVELNDAVFGMDLAVIDAQIEVERIARALETLGMTAPAEVLRSQMTELRAKSQHLVDANGRALGEMVKQAGENSRNLLLATMAGAGIAIDNLRKEMKNV